MKHSYLLLSFIVVSSFLGRAQDQTTFQKNFQGIDTELKNWDPIRGAWLSSSLQAMASDEAVPDRTFPEDFTPYQMLNKVPNETRLKIATLARTNTESGTDQAMWTRVDDIVAIRDCSPVSARTYGDPHLVSYDGERYSFQTVGEFNLTTSESGNVIVQTRQKVRDADFSNNTAVAMNVSGDRVAIYASDYPDADYSTPVRVNGQPVQVGSEAYFLDHGGTIRYSNNMYVVDWPTGESLSTNIRTSSHNNMRFMNITMNVFPCTQGGYSGLVGNANGVARDDFNNSRIMVPRTVFAGAGGDAERMRQQWLSKEYADVNRITQAESLFDYAPGQSTITFTDKSFPKFYRTLDDLTPDQRNSARRRCQQAGISESDMNGCIYDNGFLNLEPSQPHVVDDPSQGTVLRPLDGEVPNINPKPQIEKGKDIEKPSVGAQPIDKIIQDKKDTEVKEPVTKDVEPVTEPKSTDTFENKTIETVEPKPSIESKPKITFPKTNSNPAPRPTPRPAPRPTPKPKPTPRPSAPRGGGIKPGRGL